MIRRLCCWFGWHTWRVGTLGEFGPGYFVVGCACGARRPFRHTDITRWNKTGW
jgi:hypothetical protein